LKSVQINKKGKILKQKQPISLKKDLVKNENAYGTQVIGQMVDQMKATNNAMLEKIKTQ